MKGPAQPLRFGPIGGLPVIILSLLVKSDVRNVASAGIMFRTDVYNPSPYAYQNGYTVQASPYQYNYVPVTTPVPNGEQVQMGNDVALARYVSQLNRDKEGLEHLVRRQENDLSQLNAVQQQNSYLREKLEIITARCYHHEEAARAHDRERALLIGLQSKNESLQTNCNTLSGRCHDLEQTVRQQREEIERLSAYQTENAALHKSNAFFKGRCDEIEMLFAKQRDEVAAAAALRTDNANMRNTVKALEAKVKGPSNNNNNKNTRTTQGQI